MHSVSMPFSTGTGEHIGSPLHITEIVLHPSRCFDYAQHDKIDDYMRTGQSLSLQKSKDIEKTAVRLQCPTAVYVVLYVLCCMFCAVCCAVCFVLHICTIYLQYIFTPHVFHYIFVPHFFHYMIFTIFFALIFRTAYFVLYAFCSCFVLYGYYNLATLSSITAIASAI